MEKEERDRLKRRQDVGLRQRPKEGATMERAEKEERLEAIRAAVGDLEESGVPFDVLLPLYEYLAKEEGA